MAVDQRQLTILYSDAYFDSYNGSARGLHDIAKEMLARGHRPIAIFTGEGRCTREFRDSGIEVRILAVPDELNRFAKQLLAAAAPTMVRVALFGILPLWLRIALLVRRERVDIVHTNEPRSSILVGVAGRLAGRPLVVHVTGHLGGYPRPVRLLTTLLARRTILVGAALLPSVPGLVRRRARVVRRGVLAITAGGPAGPSGGPVRILQLASIQPHKGQHRLVEAIRLVNERLAAERVEVTVAGEVIDREYLAHLQAETERLGLTNLRFLDWTPDPGALLRDADIIVHPSVRHETLRLNGRTVEVRGSEGIPRALIEAALAAKPAVATDVAGVKEIVADHVTGFVVPPSDAPAMAAALEQLVLQPQLRARMGSEAGALARKRFSPEQSIAKILRVYAEVTPRRTARAPALARLYTRRR